MMSIVKGIRSTVCLCLAIGFFGDKRLYLLPSLSLSTDLFIFFLLQLKLRDENENERLTHTLSMKNSQKKKSLSTKIHNCMPNVKCQDAKKTGVTIFFAGASLLEFHKILFSTFFLFMLLLLL